ncbi:hypothetical protein Tco_0621846 [Tanacetum coccineum]
MNNEDLERVWSVGEGLEGMNVEEVKQLEFYSLMQKSECTLKNHVPIILASGIVFLENRSFKIMPWDGKGIPDVIENHSIIQGTIADTEYPFGIWSKKQFGYKKAGMSLEEMIFLSHLNQSLINYIKTPSDFESDILLKRYWRSIEEYKRKSIYASLKPKRKCRECEVSTNTHTKKTCPQDPKEIAAAKAMNNFVLVF